MQLKKKKKDESFTVCLPLIYMFISSREIIQIHVSSVYLYQCHCLFFQQSSRNFSIFKTDNVGVMLKYLEGCSETAVSF